MSILQLNPPLYLDTPLGPAACFFLWENGIEADIQFGCFLEKTGEHWWWPNSQVRLQMNISSRRYSTSPIHEAPEMKQALANHKKRNGQ